MEISCHDLGPDDRKCVETAVQINAFVPWLVSVGKIEAREYEVLRVERRWRHDGGPQSPCQREVLTMDFPSGRVRVSDIPIPRPGTTCTLLDQETHSYRLVRGHYYVDTSPNNDVGQLDKPKNK